MPYSKLHKQKTREKILQSAYFLFSTRGYDAVTLDDIMSNCLLTRGAFYAHFESKSALYYEALKFSAANTALANPKPEGLSSKAWLGQLLDVYLSVEHVKGDRACPLAFLVTDISAGNKDTKAAYTHSYKQMNKLIMQYAEDVCQCTKQQLLSLTAMMIGAVAVARSMDDTDLIDGLLASCRQQARTILDGV